MPVIVLLNQEKLGISSLILYAILKIKMLTVLIYWLKDMELHLLSSFYLLYCLNILY